MSAENHCGVGGYRAAPPSAGNTQRGLTHPLDSTETGGLLTIMVAPRYDTTPAPTPDYAELRARNLLALAILNHRRTADGLSAPAVEDIYEALTGFHDRPDEVA